MTMAEKIKYYRELLKISQEELGGRLNPPVNKAAVQKWEKGTVENIKRTYILQLSNIFGITPNELLSFDKSEVNDNDFLIKIPNNDIGTSFNILIEQLMRKDSAIMFEGEPIDEESKRLLAYSLKSNFETAQMLKKSNKKDTK